MKAYHLVMIMTETKTHKKNKYKYTDKDKYKVPMYAIFVKSGGLRIQFIAPQNDSGGVLVFEWK